MIWAFMEYSSSVLSPLALFDKIRTPDLADFLIQQVHKQMLPPPSQEAWPSGEREGQVQECPLHVQVDEIRASHPLPSAVRHILHSGHGP